MEMGQRVAAGTRRKVEKICEHKEKGSSPNQLLAFQEKNKVTSAKLSCTCRFYKDLQYKEHADVNFQYNTIFPLLSSTYFSPKRISSSGSGSGRYSTGQEVSPHLLSLQFSRQNSAKTSSFDSRSELRLCSSASTLCIQKDFLSSVRSNSRGGHGILRTLPEGHSSISQSHPRIVQGYDSFGRCPTLRSELEDRQEYRQDFFRRAIWADGLQKPNPSSCRRNSHQKGPYVHDRGHRLHHGTGGLDGQGSKKGDTRCLLQRHDKKAKTTPGSRCNGYVASIHGFRNRSSASREDRFRSVSRGVCIQQNYRQGSEQREGQGVQRTQGCFSRRQVFVAEKTYCQTTASPTFKTIIGPERDADEGYVAAGQTHTDLGLLLSSVCREGSRRMVQPGLYSRSSGRLCVCRDAKTPSGRDIKSLRLSYSYK